MKCPAQDTKYWKHGAIFDAKCPKCTTSVEFFKDDTSRKCSQCGHQFVNPQMDFGCAAYCPHAEQCLGALEPEISSVRDSLMKNKISILAKKTLGSDFAKISAMLRRMRYAQTVGVSLGVSMASLIMAAIVYDTPNPAELLSQGQVNNALSKEIIDLIDRQKSGQFPISELDNAFWDAVTLAQLELNSADINTVRLYTDSGKSEATYLKEGK